MSESPEKLSLLYWRRWRPLSCDPVLLRLAKGMLELTTATGDTEFRVPVAQVLVRFTWRSTMQLAVDGERYDLVGVPLWFAPPPSDAQLRQVAPGLVERRRAGMLGAAAAGAGSSGVAGVAALGTAYTPGRKAVRAWRSLLLPA